MQRVGAMPAGSVLHTSACVFRNVELATPGIPGMFRECVENGRCASRYGTDRKAPDYRHGNKDHSGPKPGFLRQSASSLAPKGFTGGEDKQHCCHGQEDRHHNGNSRYHSFVSRAASPSGDVTKLPVEVRSANSYFLFEDAVEALEIAQEGRMEFGQGVLDLGQRPARVFPLPYFDHFRLHLKVAP
jgi:hypothetical protein